MDKGKWARDFEQGPMDTVKWTVEKRKLSFDKCKMDNGK